MERNNDSDNIRDYDDLHMCVICRELFIGIGAYLMHRKEGCHKNNVNVSSIEERLYKPDAYKATNSSGDVCQDSQVLVENCTSEVQPRIAKNHMSGESFNCIPTENKYTNSLVSCEKSPNLLDHIYCLKPSAFGTPSHLHDQDNNETAIIPLLSPSSYKNVSAEIPLQAISQPMEQNIETKYQTTSVNGLNCGRNSPTLTFAEFLSTLELKHRSGDNNRQTTDDQVDFNEFFSSLELKYCKPEETSTNVVSTSHQVQDTQPSVKNGNFNAESKCSEINTNLIVAVSEYNSGIKILNGPNIVGSQNLKATSVEYAREKDLTQTTTKKQAGDNSQFSILNIPTSNENARPVNAKITPSELASPKTTYPISLERRRKSAFEERLQDLKVSSILKEIDFSSDSESLLSDVEELLNFSDEEQPTESGGKWKPGGKDEAHYSRVKGKPASSGKLASHLRHAGKSAQSNGGKWKPGFGPNSSHRPVTSQVRSRGGKQFSYKGVRGLTDSEDENQAQDEEDHELNQNKDDAQSGDNDQGLTCATCKKSFKSPYYLASHIKTKAHKRNCAESANCGKGRFVSFKCPLCQYSSKKKANFARHLRMEMSQSTENRAHLMTTLSAEWILVLNKQRKYQCRICDVYTDERHVFMTHVTSDVRHAQKSEQLLGSLLCVRCHCYYTSNADLVKHLNESKHCQTEENSKLPCVIKESRTRVSCRDCGKQCLSATKLQQHMDSCHSGQNIPTHRTRGVRHKPYCPCCNKQWASDSALSVHMSRRRAHKPFHCVTCKVAFSSNGDLTRHYKSEKHLDQLCKLGSPNESQSNTCPASNSTITAINSPRYNINVGSHQRQINDAQSIIENEQTSVESNHPAAISNPIANNFSAPKKNSTQTHTIMSKNTGTKSTKPTKPTGYKCKYEDCSYRAARQGELRAHYAHHVTTGPRFHCALCNYSAEHKSHFTTHLGSKRHIRLSAKHKHTDNDANNDSGSNEREKISSQNCVINSKQSSSGRFQNKKSKKTKSPDITEIDARNLRPGKNQNMQDIIGNGNIFQENNNTNTEEHKCDKCNLVFCDNAALLEHVSRHIMSTEKEFVKQRCGGDELRFCAEKYHDYVTRLPRDPLAIVTCPECSQSMTRSQILAHLRQHANIKPFQCIYCDKTFTKGSLLRIHIYKNHLPSKTLQCEFCSKQYVNKTHLNQHLLRHHRNLIKFKPKYECHKCDAEFMIRYYYINHLKTHSSVKPYRCPHPGCIIGFWSKSALKYHSRVHSKEKPFLCDQCGFAAACPFTLRRHKKQKSHTADRRFKCDYCTFSSVTHSALLRHNRIHAGSRAYTCPHCEFRTHDLSRLRKHFFRKKDHTGLSLYQCHLCREQFDFVKEFREHLFKVHKQEVTSRKASVLAGVFDESRDSVAVSEGQMVIPVQEKYYKKNNASCVINS